MEAEQVEKLMEALGCKSLSRGNSGYINGTCPLHHDTRPSFGINYTQPNHPWTCFRCGSGASVVTLVSRVFDMSRANAEAYARQFGDITLPDLGTLERFFSGTSSGPKPDTEDLISVFPMATKYRNASIVDLLKRKIRSETRTGRVIVPFYRNGVCLGAVSNRVGKEGNKTTPLLGFSHKEHVYEMPGSKNTDTVVVVEALDSEIAVTRAGFRCVSTFGKPSASQLAELPRINARRVILMLDSDEAGTLGTADAAKKLCDVCTVFVCTPAKQKVDIAGMTSEEISLAIDGAKLYASKTASGISAYRRS